MNYGSLRAMILYCSFPGPGQLAQNLAHSKCSLKAYQMTILDHDWHIIPLHSNSLRAGTLWFSLLTLSAPGLAPAAWNELLELLWKHFSPSRGAWVISLRECDLEEDPKLTTQHPPPRLPLPPHSHLARSWAPPCGQSEPSLQTFSLLDGEPRKVP